MPQASRDIQRRIKSVKSTKKITKAKNVNFINYCKKIQ